MKRRKFITLLGGAAAWPLAVRAQQPGMPVIGYLNASVADANSDQLRAFRQGLTESGGYVEGQNVAIDYRWGENEPARLPALAADLVRRRVNVIAVVSNPASIAAAKATTAIPIVFVVAEDPVRLGLVASLARPGGNATGINFFSAELAAKRLELLRTTVPAATRVAALLNPAEAMIAEANRRGVEAAASAMGLQLRLLSARTSTEIDATFATFANDRPDALFISSGPFFTSRRVQGTPYDALWGPGDCFGADLSRGRRADELWRKCASGASSGRRLCRSHPEGREARRPAGRAVHQV